MDSLPFQKLKSVAHLLKVSGRFHFQNFNLKLFSDVLMSEPETGIIAQSLLSRYPDSTRKAREALVQTGDPVVPTIRRTINSFEEWVAFCIAYIRYLEVNQGNPAIDRFIVYAGQEDLTTIHEQKKNQFYNECIEPILTYIELQIKQSLNAIYILQRYKVLCEWYERENLIEREEVDLTKDHLSKYLFDQGFTYSLSETAVPSGRIDNLALNIGLRTREEFGALPTAIVAEAKLFTGEQRAIIQVRDQAWRRARDLAFKEAYCVVFNKTPSRLRLLSKEGTIAGLPYIVRESLKIIVMVIDLHEAFYKSITKVREVTVDLDS